MRNDMAKVVTERPRRGSGSKYRWVRRRNGRFTEDDVGGIQGMQKPYGWDTKDFTDVLGPLEGYLRKNAGRPWDKVYSEICQHLPANSNQGSHIRDHVMQFVETNVIMRGKIPCNSLGSPIGSGYRNWADFFVHPKTGILVRVKKKTRKWKYRKKQYIAVVGGRHFAMWKCIWYELIYKTFSRSQRPLINDLFLGQCQVNEWDYHCELRKRYGGDFYCDRKKQVSGREIERLKLRSFDVEDMYQPPYKI